MALLPITLGVTRRSDRKRTSPLFDQPIDEAAARAAVMKRDDYTCRFCGFRALKYQQAHFLNGDRRDWRQTNLVTACIFCDQCFSLERVAQMRSGALIWLPEFAQAALSHVCRAIYIAQISPGSMAEPARFALDMLLQRREEAKRRLGTDDPATLSAALQDYLEESDYDLRKRKLNGVKLLPMNKRIVQEADIEFNQFPQILAFWRSKDGPFSGALPATWQDSFQAIAGMAA